MYNPLKPPGQLKIEDSEIDNLLEGLDRKRQDEDFSTVDLKHGNWHLTIKFRNAVEDKKNLLEVMTFCRNNLIKFKLVDKNEQFMILEFSPSLDSLVLTMPDNFAKILNQYLFGRIEPTIAAPIQDIIRQSIPQAREAISVPLGRSLDDREGNVPLYVQNANPKVQPPADEVLTANEDEGEITVTESDLESDENFDIDVEDI